LSRTPQTNRKPSGEIAETARVVLGVTVVLALATSDFFAALGWATDRFGKRWRALAQRVSDHTQRPPVCEGYRRRQSPPQHRDGPIWLQQLTPVRPFESIPGTEARGRCHQWDFP
jgi:hypothetical protein